VVLQFSKHVALDEALPAAVDVLLGGVLGTMQLDWQIEA